ncbi:zf-HC2 domain-containing protein [Promicromonospora thailandica]|uniref:RNA polymerase sigma factor, sigma-70 family n=1 Tax=Promicromonospora thailandica TaxID=765201 RepID=A0A9X2G3T8_9MICO|nr:sigma-70 family RNA polymerase sigma factor [Promicromonospora thailandica]MCP2266560.1 RNA polymerase sigma factor, sigma-70 family [Promicromonospora thailandica]
MTAARALQIDDWVVHRPNVVRSVMARVPGVDAEEAASRALEKMVRIVSTGGSIADPAPYWRRAAMNEAISLTREAGRTTAVEDDALDGLAPPVEGAEPAVERQADVAMLRAALADLADDDRRILVERHVHDRAVSEIASGLGVRPHAVTMRLRRAEERLAGAFAAAHAQAVNEPECRATRAAMHDYLKDRLLPRRRGRVEAHMDGCAECTRAFLDVREVSWMLRDLGQHVVAGAVATGALGAGVGAGLVGGGAGSAGGAGGSGGGAGGRRFGTKEAAVAAAVAAAVVGGGAAALAALQPDDPPAAQSVQAPPAGADGAGGGGAAGGGPGGGGDGSGGGAGGRGDGSGDGSGGGAGDGAGDGSGGGAAGSDNGTVAGGSDSGAGAAAGDDPAGAGGDGPAVDGSDAAVGSDASGAGTTDDQARGDGADGTSGTPDETSGGATGEPRSGAEHDDAASDGGAGSGGRADGQSADGPGRAETAPVGVGAAVRDLLAGLGIGDGTPDQAAGDTGRTGSTGTVGVEEDGSSNGSDNAGDPGTDDLAPPSGTTAPPPGAAGPTGTDASGPRVGAELLHWFARLGIAGVPAFLLVVFVLWLWERWTRTDNQ